MALIKKKDVEIIKTSLKAILLSLGGWITFKGVVSLFNLSAFIDKNPLLAIFVGLLIGWAVFKFGIKKK